MNKKDTLNEIFQNDPFNLLDVENEKPINRYELYLLFRRIQDEANKNNTGSVIGLCEEGIETYIK